MPRPGHYMHDDERAAMYRAWDWIEYRRANPRHTATMWPNPTPSKETP